MRKLSRTLFAVLYIVTGLTSMCAAVVGAQTLKVDVDLVLDDAVVSDSHGRAVTGLQSENFRLWEDNVEQKVEYFSGEETPASIGLIFDASGSMSDKLARAREAAVTFLKTGNPNDEYFLVTFSQRPRLAENFTTDISRLQNYMLMTASRGMTQDSCEGQPTPRIPPARKSRLKSAVRPACGHSQVDIRPRLRHCPAPP